MSPPSPHLRLYHPLKCPTQSVNCFPSPTQNISGSFLKCQHLGQSLQLINQNKFFFIIGLKEINISYENLHVQTINLFSHYLEGCTSSTGLWTSHVVATWKAVLHPQDNVHAMLLPLVDLLLQHLHQDTQNLGANGNFTIISIVMCNVVTFNVIRV